MSGSKTAGLWWAPAIALLLLALWAIRPIGVDAPRSIATPFDTARAIGRLRVILGDERPHPVDSDASDAVLARLLGQLRADGFVPELRERFHCNDIRPGAAICAKPRNVAFWVTHPGDDAVMLMAHTDSVPTGPGAADDGIGVAVALEVAHLLKGRKLGRPVLVLLNDAEEAGLVGAAAFAAHDPLARRVGAVVNLEARGTTGSANMFQTSNPNGNDIAALAKGQIVPSANSLATNLYEHMPNDSDLTMLLPLGVDAANYAMIGGGKRYHTRLDNLAHLNPDTVRHMGANALSAVIAFTKAKPQKPEGRLVFTDLNRTLFLALPPVAAGLILALGLVAAIVLAARLRGGQPWRTALAPPVALVAGTGLAFLISLFVAAIRPEAAYGTAHPAVFRLAWGAAALAGAAIALRLLRLPFGAPLTASAWAWLTGLVLTGFVFVPGIATLAAWPLLFVAAAALAAFVPRLRPTLPWLLPVLLGAAALLFALVILPCVGGLEDALFVESAAPTSLFLVFLLLFVPIAGDRPRWATAWTCSAVLLAATPAALLVPAYTRDAPRHLTLVHEDRDGKAAFLLPANEALPSAMAAAATFGATPDAKGNWHAPAPRLVDDGTFTVLSDTTDAAGRTIAVRALSPLADNQQFHVSKGEGIRGITVNGANPRIKAPLVYAGCTGRACRQLDVTFRLAPGAPLPELRWERMRFGAGPDAARLIAARPDTAQPVHSGDRQIIVRQVRLDAK